MEAILTVLTVIAVGTAMVLSLIINYKNLKR
jgi:hypothetical protein